MPIDLLYSDLTYKIRRAVFNVYNRLGFGHKEQIYHKALALEFDKLSIIFKDEWPVNVLYDTHKVGTYKPDFVVDEKVLIEIKALPFMGREPESQMIYYLKGTNYKVGLLINFGSKRLDIRRKVWSGNYPRKSAINPR